MLKKSQEQKEHPEDRKPIQRFTIYLENDGSRVKSVICSAKPLSSVLEKIARHKQKQLDDFNCTDLEGVPIEDLDAPLNELGVNEINFFSKEDTDRAVIRTLSPNPAEITMSFKTVKNSSQRKNFIRQRSGPATGLTSSGEAVQIFQLSKEKMRMSEEVHRLQEELQEQKQENQKQAEELEKLKFELMEVKLQLSVTRESLASPLKYDSPSVGRKGGPRRLSCDPPSITELPTKNSPFLNLRTQSFKVEDVRHGWRGVNFGKILTLPIVI